MNGADVIGEIEGVEVIAKGVSVRERHRLAARFGRARWQKMKGEATVRLANGTTRRAELHWYEAHGFGRRKMKIKRFLE